LEERIESIILDKSEELPRPIGEKLGHKSINESAPDDYINFIKSTVDTDLKGIKVAIDCANGAAYKVAPIALFDLGAEVSVTYNEPDGININNGCGSTHISKLQQFVVETGADIGLAFDGDADRVLAVDEKGNLIDGDQIMTIIGLDLKSKNKLADNTIVATVMSNLGLDI
jgi:phosphoglucosamine mutase